jgi:hypothetical protein
MRLVLSIPLAPGAKKSVSPQPAGVLEKVQQQRAAACDNAVRAALRQHRVSQITFVTVLMAF